MATSTLGTAATTTLTSLINAGSMNPIDLAAIINAIKDDLNPAHPLIPGSYSQLDLLYVPNRGILKVLPGDFVGVDSQGWPILVSANSAASAAWVHT